MLLNFKYFQADRNEVLIESELPAKLKNENYSLQCKFCGSTEMCMPLTNDTFMRDGESIIELDSPYKPGSGIYTHYGCIDCLRNRKFEYRHNTEPGELRESGFMRFDYKAGCHLAIEQQPNISKESIDELRITPPFRAWQGPCWLVHCNDFMTYLGVWGYDDFKKNSQDSKAFSYFLKVTPQGTAKNYNLDPATATDEGFYEMLHGEYAEATCYAFRCIHCNTHRVSLDNP